jgi:hypothetical protein
VLKDIGGELINTQQLERILSEPDAKHLYNSDWLILALDAHDDLELGRSVDYIRTFLRDYETCQGSRAQVVGPAQRQCAGVVVLLTRVDGRLAGRSPDQLIDAVRAQPNRFAGELVDLSLYFKGMIQVQKEVKAVLKREAPLVVEDLEKLFNRDRIHYAATSSLGMQPVKLTNVNQPRAEGGFELVYEGQCISEPALIRVLDPLLWVIRSEGVNWDRAGKER